MAWTDERIDRLKSLWSQGMTASQIADELGGVSRNAVIGKAHRLGLEARPSPVRSAEEVVEAGEGHRRCRAAPLRQSRLSSLPSKAPEPSRGRGA